MELHEIENGILQTDATAKSAGSAMADLKNRAEQCESRAYALRWQADDLQRMAYREEDPERAESYRVEAEALEARADECLRLGREIRNQLAQLVDMLQNCRMAYERFQEECRISLQKLMATAEKLNQAAGSGYGAEKIREALALIRRKNEKISSLERGCESRIRWIDTVIGQDDNPYVRSRRLHRITH